MPNPQVVAALVRQAYGAQPVALEPLGNDPTGERLTYRVALSDGRVLLLRGYLAGSRVPFWNGGGPSEAWLRERARVLDWLARHDYPAPRVIPARGGDPLAIQSGYCVLALTYLPGQRLPTTADHLRRLSGALGRLHALGHASSSAPLANLPASWWHPPAQTVTPLLDQLADMRTAVPSRWQPLHAAFIATLEATHDHRELPLSIIHGDCFPANAILTDEGQVALVDWDCAGLGAAVLDLGTLLLDAHPDPTPGTAITVNPALVSAIVAGYREQREPSALERTALLDATRFGVAFIGSLRFAWAREQGWTARIERSLRRLEARYHAAAEVARLASAAFGGGHE